MFSSTYAVTEFTGKSLLCYVSTPILLVGRNIGVGTGKGPTSENYGNLPLPFSVLGEEELPERSSKSLRWSVSAR